ncbi:MAG: protein-tyrosine-phosphatase [Flavobacteriaceae bacterium]|nr:protein-tyrosine-phosphatase [Flavobacteriaceae bacterium]
MINDKISNFILKLDTSKIPRSRIKALDLLIQQVRICLNKGISTQLNFICTNNSRRSQFCQIWSETLAYYYDYKNISSFSGGTEITEIYNGVINSLIKTGFNILKDNINLNPVYSINFGESTNTITVYSKLFNCNLNPKSDFIAIINCSSANENCPFLAGASKRISMPFDDPKFYDGSKNEMYYYNKINIEIATSFKYLYLNI